eukprot:GEMP01029950.1.p1 GENE.GEMP01029950.1~~GEMP01029950.1.p1  ORF type:complete len:180 (+),score=15.08 GEMP01029950.1:74-613(+)
MGNNKSTLLCTACNCRSERDHYGLVFSTEAGQGHQEIDFDEKTLLERSVRSFVRLALKGVPCQRMTKSTGELVFGSYYINKTLTTLTFAPDLSTTCETVDVDIPSIESVYIEGGENEYADLGAKRRLSWPIEKNSVFYPSVSIMQSNDDELTVCVGNRIEAEKFTTCMRILRYYNYSAD